MQFNFTQPDYDQLPDGSSFLLLLLDTSPSISEEQLRQIRSSIIAAGNGLGDEPEAESIVLGVARFASGIHWVINFKPILDVDWETEVPALTRGSDTPFHNAVAWGHGVLATCREGMAAKEKSSKAGLMVMTDGGNNHGASSEALLGPALSTGDVVRDYVRPEHDSTLIAVRKTEDMAKAAIAQAMRELGFTGGAPLTGFAHFTQTVKQVSKKTSKRVGGDNKVDPDAVF